MQRTVFASSFFAAPRGPWLELAIASRLRLPWVVRAVIHCRVLGDSLLFEDLYKLAIERELGERSAAVLALRGFALGCSFAFHCSA